MATTCVIQNCNFISAKDEAVIMPSNNTHKLTKCIFIKNPNAMRFPTAGTNYVLDYCNFLNNTIDIDNTSAGQVTISVTNSTNPPTTKTGSTTINVDVWLRVYVKNEADEAVIGASVAIYKTDMTQLMNEVTVNDGQGNALAEETYNYPGSPVAVIIRVRKSSTAPKYFPLNTSGNIYSTGLTLTAVLIKDNIAI